MQQSQLAAAAPSAVERRALFPRDPDQQSVAVLDVLADAGRPLHPDEIARRFRSTRRRLRAEIQESLLLLTQNGQLALLPGGRYPVRRAA